MKKILYLTHEGIGSSIFRSQIIQHCISMKKSNKIDILVNNTIKKIWNKSVSNKSKYEKLIENKIILKKGVWIHLPFSSILNAFFLIKFLLSCKKEYSIIHARTEYSTFIAILTKFFHRLPVIWDSRGDSIDELKLSFENKSGLLFFYKIYLIFRQKFIVFINQKYSDHMFFVSKELKNLYLRNNKKKNVTIIPCLVPSKLYFFYLKNRIKYREILGVKKNELLFIYSGSMAVYQSIDKLLNLFKNILNNKHHILILTTQINKAKINFQKLSNYKNISFLSVPYEHVNYYNSAADFGIMIRSNRSTNWVASPTKFGEYCMSGLTILHNNSIQQVNELCKKFKNNLSRSLSNITPMDYNKRILIASKAIMFFSRNNYIKYYNKVYENLKSKN